MMFGVQGIKAVIKGGVTEVGLPTPSILERNVYALERSDGWLVASRDRARPPAGAHHDLLPGRRCASCLSRGRDFASRDTPVPMADLVMDLLQIDDAEPELLSAVNVRGRMIDRLAVIMLAA